MKKYLFLTLFLVQGAFAQSAPSPKKIALESCVYDISFDSLQIVKRTVGLKNPETQLKALYGLSRWACVQDRRLDKLDGLDEAGADAAVVRGLERALQDVFGIPAPH